MFQKEFRVFNKRSCVFYDLIDIYVGVYARICCVIVNRRIHIKDTILKQFTEQQLRDSIIAGNGAKVGVSDTVAYPAGWTCPSKWDS